MILREKGITNLLYRASMLCNDRSPVRRLPLTHFTVHYRVPHREVGDIQRKSQISLFDVVSSETTHM
jgi:hypothetical protein